MDDKNTVSEDERRRFEEQLAQASKKVGSASSDLGNSAQAASTSLSNGIDTLASVGAGLVTFGKGLVSSQGNLAKVGESVESASGGIGGALMAMGPFGFIIGGLIKIVGKLVGAVLKTDQQLVENYDKLADLGGQTNFTTEKLRELAQTTGATLNGGYFDKLVDSTKSLGTTLLSLGKTSGQGMEAFMKVAAYSKDTATQLQNLGINYEKFNQIQADYFNLQSRLGLQRNKSTDTLHKESRAYAQSLIELAAVTGLSTEQLRKKQQDEMEDFAWNVKMREMSMTEEGAKRANMLNDMIVQMRELGGNLDADALKDILSNGYSTTAQANQMITRVASAGGNYIEWVEKLRKDGDYESFLIKIQKANEESLRVTGDATKADADARAALGQSTDMIKMLSKNLEKGVRANVHQETENAKDAKGRNNDLNNLRNEANDLSRKFNLALDVLTGLISGPVNTALQALFHGLKALSKGFLEFLVRTGMAVDPALPYLFDSQEEIAAQLKEIPKKLAENQKMANDQQQAAITTSPEAAGGIGFSDDSGMTEQLRLREIGLRKAAKLMNMNLEAEQKQNKDQKQQQNKEKKEQDAKNKKEEQSPDKKKEETNQKVEVKTEPKKDIPNDQRPSKPYPADAKPKTPAMPEPNKANKGDGTGEKLEDPSPEKAILSEKKSQTQNKNFQNLGQFNFKDMPTISVDNQYEKLLDDIKNIVVLSNSKTLSIILKKKEDEKNEDIVKKEGFLTKKVEDFKSLIAAHLEKLSNIKDKSDKKDKATTQGPESKKQEGDDKLAGSVPLPSGMNIPISFTNLPTDLSPKADSMLSNTDEVKGILENYMENLSTKIDTFNKTEPVEQKQQKITPALLEVVTSRMDALLDKMKENTDIQSELLQISRA